MNETTPERWLPVVGYEGIYEVSDLGQVRSLDRVISRRNSPYVLRGRVLRPAVNRRGYLHLNLYGDGWNESRYVHHLVLEAFAGPRPAGTEARHLDGVPNNNSVANLTWGTHVENAWDIIRHGRNWQANKDCCDKGHEFTPENTRFVYRPDGTVRQRLCRTCRRQTAREVALRKRAAKLPKVTETAPGARKAGTP